MTITDADLRGDDPHDLNRFVRAQADSYEQALAEVTAGRKRSAFISVGEDTVIEAAQPLYATSPEGRDLEANGEGVHAVTFKTLNLKRAADYLRSKNQRIEAEAADSFTLNVSDSFGMPMSFTDRAIPNDPRS